MNNENGIAVYLFLLYFCSVFGLGPLILSLPPASWPDCCQWLLWWWDKQQTEAGREGQGQSFQGHPWPPLLCPRVWTSIPWCHLAHTPAQKSLLSLLRGSQFHVSWLLFFLFWSSAVCQALILEDGTKMNLHKLVHWFVGNLIGKTISNIV